MRALAAAAACAVMLIAGCSASDDAADSPRPTLVDAVTTAGAGERAVIEGEAFVSVRTLPAEALSAEKLESAGTAENDAGERITMARARAAGVEPWELVSAAADGWRVWRPQIVLDALADAGSSAALVEVETVDWPDACVGAAGADEICAQIVTPGYRVIVEQSGRQIEYHTARTSMFRRVTPS